MNKKNYTLLLFFMAMAFSLNAQEIWRPLPSGIEWTLEEKIKIDPANMPQNVDGSSLKTDGTEMYTDGPVTMTNNIDAEVHALINPLDSQNIVVSPIRQSNMGMSVPIYYTNNFGGNWTKSGFNAMPAVQGGMTVGGGDPVFAADKNGRLYFSWIDLHIENSMDTINWGFYWAYSDDNGQNWVKPADNVIAYARIVTASQTYLGDIADKQWMACDFSSSAYKNSLYISFVSIDVVTGAYEIRVKHKREADTAMNPVHGVVSDSTFQMVQFASLAVDDSGHVHVAFFGTKDQLNYALYHAVSKDGGVTFSTSEKVSDLQLPRFSFGQTNGSINGISDERLYPSAYMTADTTNGNLYLTWTANGVTSKLNNGLDIYFSASTDGGNTWSAASVVNDNTDNLHTDQFYSSITVGTEGNVVLAWYDRRGDSTNYNAHMYMSESFDGGATWSPNYQVTTLHSDFAKVGAANNDFGIGEYTQVLALKDYIIPVWTDGRLNNGNLNTFAAFINRKTMSIEEISTVAGYLSIETVYPNPVENQVNVDFTLDKSEAVQFVIFDMQGRVIDVRSLGEKASGQHTITIDATSYAPGTYLIGLEAGGQIITKKIFKL